MTKALVAGWFSFENGHATAGDLMSRDLVSAWLKSCRIDHDIANDQRFGGGVNWRLADWQQYSHVIFVCGPFSPGELEAEFLNHFANCRLIGLNLSIGVPLKTWNPFDLLIARDSSAETNADLVFLSTQNRVPVVGLCLVEDHPEAEVEFVNAVIARFVRGRGIAVVPIDTRLDTNETGLRNPREIESLISRMDALITTRLHGVVLALKNSVPAVALDAVAGGGKISRQCTRIGWTNVVGLSEMDERRLGNALDYALTSGARGEARACAGRAMEIAGACRDRFLNSLAQPQDWEVRFNGRQSVEGMEAFRASLALTGKSSEGTAEIDETERTSRWSWRRLRNLYGRIGSTGT